MIRKRIIYDTLCMVTRFTLCNRFSRENFKEYGIKTDNCPILEASPTCTNATAVIIVNAQNGSRTIMANTRYSHSTLRFCILVQIAVLKKDVFLESKNLYLSVIDLRVIVVCLRN